jgi:hypothetical protein
MKWTSRLSLSSLATMIGALCRLASLSASASCGRRSRASLPLPVLHALGGGPARVGGPPVPLRLGRPLGRAAPRVVGRSRSPGRTAPGVSGWRHGLGLRTAVRLGSLGGAAAGVVLRRSARSRAAASVLGSKNLSADAGCQNDCASVFGECHGRLLKSPPRLKHSSAFKTLVPSLIGKLPPSPHSQRNCREEQ